MIPPRRPTLPAAHPDKVAALQARINALGQESTKALALAYIAGVGLKHGKPVIASESGEQALIGGEGPSITDEGVGDDDDHH